MTDGWSDRKRRSIMNLCVNCKLGTSFISSREDSASSHTGECIFQYVDKHIEDIGPENVVQVVTDNATNNMAAASLLKAKRPSIFWTSCATHTINLMLEGIGKLPRYKAIIDKAKNFTIFIYAHTKTLSLMRQYTKSREIIRPRVTRFATAFLTLQSLMEKREKLRRMVTSNEWNDNLKLSKSAKGITSMATVLSVSFWNRVEECLKVFEPLVKVLRLVDGDKKPSMGLIYGELKKASEDVKLAVENVESLYRPILAIMHDKSKGRLDSPLHLASYLLNPYYTYNDHFIGEDGMVKDGFISCVERMYECDIEKQEVLVNKEIQTYLQKEGSFGKELSKKMCSPEKELFDPVHWWSMYGNGVPTLQAMAKRILSLTTSSSGCERNWSTFESVHTKKRNRLESIRLNNLVYVQFNNKLINKKKRGTENVCTHIKTSDVSNTQGWMFEEEEDEDLWEAIGIACEADDTLEARRSERHVQERELRELDDDIESEPENVNYDFDSDEE